MSQTLEWVYPTSGVVPQGFVSWPVLKPTLLLDRFCHEELVVARRWEEVAVVALTAALVPWACPG